MSADLVLPPLPAFLDRRETLPVLIDRARQRLAEARDAAEVLEAKQYAEAALHLAKVLKAASDTQADLLRIITRAEMRMADEIDAAQSTGEIAKAGGDRQSIVRTSDNGEATFDKLRLDRRRVSEWRLVRDAGEGVWEGAIARALDEGRAPTKADILKDASAISTERAFVKRRRREQRERELGTRQIEMPTKRYGVIYADPPWRFQPYSRDSGMDRAADNHFPTMTLDRLRELEIPAAADAILWLWVTVPFEAHGHELLKRWGFAYVSQFVWAKDRIGTGYWNRNQHEPLLIGTRGNIPAPSPGTQFPSLLEAPVGRHSEKPQLFYALIESYFPTLPRIELFARGARVGWDAWGDEVEAAP